MVNPDDAINTLISLISDGIQRHEIIPIFLLLLLIGFWYRRNV